MAGYLLDSQVM